MVNNLKQLQFYIVDNFFMRYIQATEYTPSKYSNNVIIETYLHYEHIQIARNSLTNNKFQSQSTEVIKLAGGSCGVASCSFRNLIVEILSIKEINQQKRSHNIFL